MGKHLWDLLTDCFVCGTKLLSSSKSRIESELLTFLRSKVGWGIVKRNRGPTPHARVSLILDREAPHGASVDQRRRRGLILNRHISAGLSTDHLRPRSEVPV